MHKNDSKYILNNYVEKTKNDASSEVLKNNFVKNTNYIGESSLKTPSNNININSIQNHGFINLRSDKISNMLSFNKNNNDKSNYFVYLWYDIILCRNTQTYKIDEVKKLLSFNNIVAMSFENIESKLNNSISHKVE